VCSNLKRKTVGNETHLNVTTSPAFGEDKDYNDAVPGRQIRLTMDDDAYDALERFVNDDNDDDDFETFFERALALLCRLVNQSFMRPTRWIPRFRV
jgi:hypothetical protein